VLEFPSYGWPRMTAELKRCGWAVNHKRVYRLMREDNLLCLRRRNFVVTTDSDHDLPVYPNLARENRADGSGSALGIQPQLITLMFILRLDVQTRLAFCICGSVSSLHNQALTPL